jgi:hypothetical protein
MCALFVVLSCCFIQDEKLLCLAHRLIPREGQGFVVGGPNEKIIFSKELAGCLSRVLEASASLAKQPWFFAPAYGALSAARLLLVHSQRAEALSAEDLGALRSLSEHLASALVSSGKLLRSKETSCSLLLLICSGISRRLPQPALARLPTSFKI